MKKLVHLHMLFVVLFCVISTASAVDSIKFDLAFGGKGAGGGGFSKNIHINFDNNDNIYISDADNKMVQKLSPDGRFLMQIPKEKTDELLFNKPGDICVDSAGNIYVADSTATHIKSTENPRIYIFAPCVYKFSPDGKLLDTFFVGTVDALPKIRPKTALPVRVVIDENGQSGFGIQPKGHDRRLLVDVDSKQNLYVLDVENCVVFKLDQTGKAILNFGRYGAGDGEFDDATDIEIDQNDNVLVADNGNHRVLKFDSEGKFQFAIGKKGRGDNEFIKPLQISVIKNGDILVKDSSQFTRAMYQHPFYENGLYEAPYARSLALGLKGSQQSEIDLLRERIKLLEESEYYGYFDGDKEGGKKEEEDEERKAYRLRKTVYHNVIERIQRFNARGIYKQRAIYKIDKQSEEHHDLKFLAIDPSGRIYLRDEGELTIMRYKIGGLVTQIDAVYSARPEYSDSSFVEDYEDVDEKTDLKDEEKVFNISQSFLINYDLSERWNLTFQDTVSYGERDAVNILDAKREDSYEYGNEGYDNIFDANLKFVTNPNAYRYKELNLYTQVLYGKTDSHSKAMFTDVNKQEGEGKGDAKGLIFGMDWDILSRANLSVEYLNLDPNYTGSNFTRKYWDISGDLYEVFRSENRASILTGELNIKF